MNIPILKYYNTKIQKVIGNKVDKVDGKGLSTNDLSNTLKNNYDTAYTHSQSTHAPSTAEKNIIVGIQKNGSDLTINASTRKVNVTVPTKTSELTNDSGFKTTDNNTTYELTKSGSTITLTGSDGSETSVTDSNTTYSNFIKSGSGAKAGLVPAPSTTAGTTKYLREDGTWATPPDTNTTYSATNGIALSGTTFSNSGVREIASGSTNGTISVNTNGTSADVAVKGLGSAAYKTITDSTSASAISTGTSLVTERDVYYGLPTINDSHTYNYSTNIYAPTAVGSSGQVLKSNGSGAPSWSTLKNLDALVCTKTTVATNSTATVYTASGPPANTYDWYLIGVYSAEAMACIICWFHRGNFYLMDFSKSSATISDTDFGRPTNEKMNLSNTFEAGNYTINLTNKSLSSAICKVWRFSQ